MAKSKPLNRMKYVELTKFSSLYARFLGGAILLAHSIGYAENEHSRP